MKPNPWPSTRRQFSLECTSYAFVFGLMLVLSLTPGVVHAQGSRAAAIVLFDEAERLLDAGRIDEACRKFGESQRLDPQLGALLHYADCEERMGRLATAYAAFRDAAELALSRADSRAPLAQSRAKALEPRLVRVLLELTDTTVPKLRVSLDGTRVEKAALGPALPVDPGEHRIRVSAPGYHPWSTTLNLQTEGDTKRVIVPPLTPIVHTTQTEDPTSTRVWSYTSFGLSAIAIGAGVGFAVSAMAAADDYDNLCPQGIDCPPGTNRRLRQLADEIDLSRNISIAAFVSGAALAALGTIIWLDSDPPKQVTGSFSITALNFAPPSRDSGASLTLVGQF